MRSSFAAGKSKLKLHSLEGFVDDTRTLARFPSVRATNVQSPRNIRRFSAASGVGDPLGTASVRILQVWRWNPGKKQVWNRVQGSGGGEQGGEGIDVWYNGGLI
jgi:hypothetical protein